MKRKMNVFAIIMVVLMIITGCSAQSGPEKVVSEFAEAMKKFNFELMASKVRPENAGGQADMEDLLDNKMKEYIKSNAEKIKYAIKDTKIDGDKAIVSVDFKYVNGEPVFEAIFSEYMEQVFSSLLSEGGVGQKNEEQILEEIIRKQNKAIKESFVETKVEFETVNIDGKWYIDDVEEDVLNIIMTNIIPTLNKLDNYFY